MQVTEGIIGSEFLRVWGYPSLSIQIAIEAPAPYFTFHFFSLTFHQCNLSAGEDAFLGPVSRPTQHKHRMVVVQVNYSFFFCRKTRKVTRIRKRRGGNKGKEDKGVKHI